MSEAVDVRMRGAGGRSVHLAPVCGAHARQQRVDPGFVDLISTMTLSAFGVLKSSLHLRQRDAVPSLCVSYRTATMKCIETTRARFVHCSTRHQDV